MERTFLWDTLYRIMIALIIYVPSFLSARVGSLLRSHKLHYSINFSI